MSYTVTVSFADRVLTTLEGDPADDTADAWVVDALGMTWAFPTGPWPTQPDPQEQTVTLASRTAAELEADLVTGSPISVVATTGDGDVFASFYGRIAEPVMQPLNRGIKDKQPWVSFTVQCVDYIVDLLDDEKALVTVGPWPAEGAAARLARVRDVLTVAGFPFTMPADDPIGDLVAIDEAQVVTAFDALNAVLEEAVTSVGVDGWNRYVIQADVVDGVLVGYRLAQIVEIIGADLVDLLPGRVDLVDGLLTLIVTDSDLIVDANRVELGSTWKRSKDTQIGRVTVTGSFGTVSATNAAGTVGRGIESQLDNGPHASLLAHMLLPDAPGAWEPEQLLWRPVNVEQIGKVWFPDASEPGYVPAYVQPVIVAPIAASVDLNGAGFYAGQLRTVSLSFERGRVFVGFGIRRNLPQSADGVSSPNSLTFDAIADDFPGVTFEDVDPTLTFYDLRLARRA